MYKPLFQQRKALRFRQFQRKGYSLFACLGRVVTIGVLSVATLESASAATDDISTKTEKSDDSHMTDKEAADDPLIDRVDSLEEVEVTGSRAPLALGQAARMVTVLGRDEIQSAPVQSINDLLKMAAGVDVRQRGPIGAQTDISIRGGTNEQITILLNGINICDPQTGHNAFDLPCDVDDIERIEVLEGPAGRVYGTSSLVGAINIITWSGNRRTGSEESRFNQMGYTESRSDQMGYTKSHSDLLDDEKNRSNLMDDEESMSLRGRLEGGSFGYLSAAAGFESSAKNSPLTTLVSASYTRSDGYSRSKGDHLNSDYSGGKVYYQGGYEGDMLRLNWHAGISIKGFGSNTFYSAKYDEQYEHTTKLYTAIYGETKGKVHFRPTLYWNRSYNRFELIRGSEEKVPFNHHRTDVFGVNLNSYFDWIAGRTAFGAEFRNEDIVSGNLGEPLNHPHGDYKYGLNRSNLSLHLEHNILLRRFTLSAGFTAVKNTWNEMPFTIYPGIDASYRIGDHWKVYASYNESLRMPSFTELYYSVGGHKADKYLKPEELRAVEGGVKYNSHLVTAQASIFHHHSSNMIDWVMDTRDPEAVWQSVNHTKVNTLGQEVSATIQLQQLLQGRFKTLSVAYCHMHQSKDEQPYIQSQYSLEYLRHKVTASLKMNVVSLLDLTVKYRFQDRMGSYKDTAGQVQEYHPYSVVDARMAWNAEGYSIYAEANNLFSKRYVDYGNVPQPGIWIVAGAKIRLGL